MSDSGLCGLKFDNFYDLEMDKRVARALIDMTNAMCRSRMTAAECADTIMHATAQIRRRRAQQDTRSSYNKVATANGYFLSKVGQQTLGSVVKSAYAAGQQEKRGTPFEDTDFAFYYEEWFDEGIEASSLEDTPKPEAANNETRNKTNELDPAVEAEYNEIIRLDPELGPSIVEYDRLLRNYDEDDYDEA